MSDDVEQDDQQTGGGRDSSVIRELRAQLKEANRRTGELERQLEGAIPPDQADKLQQRAGQLAQDRWSQIVSAAGVPERWAEFVRDRVSDDDLIDQPDAVHAWLSELGSDLGNRLPPATAARLEQQVAIDDARATGTPSAGRLMSMADLSNLAEGDGRAALEAWQSGRVELPPGVARQVEANRDQPWRG